MNYVLDFERLKEKIKELPDAKPKQRALYRKNINTPGKRYLYKHVFIPMLSGETVETAELDMTAFSIDEIVDTQEYYNENIGPESHGYSAAYTVYSSFLSEQPSTGQVCFL